MKGLRILLFGNLDITGYEKVDAADSALPVNVHYCH